MKRLKTLLITINFQLIVRLIGKTIRIGIDSKIGKMVKRLNEAFADEDHLAMKNQKNKLAIELGLKRLSWEKYLLHITEVKKLR